MTGLYLWDCICAYIKYGEQFEAFLQDKFGISIEAISEILNSPNSDKLSLFRKAYTPHKKKLVSAIIFSPDDDLYGWTVCDSYYLYLLNKYNMTPPSKLNTICIDHISHVLANIKKNFCVFQYINIYNDSYKSNSYLFNTIKLFLQVNPSYSFNYTQKDLNLTRHLNQTISLITIFMTASHFQDIDIKFKFIYKLLCKGGYLMIKEYNLQNSDQIYLYDTYHDLYRVIYDKKDVSNVVRERRTKKNESNYKSDYEWVKYLNALGLTFIAKYTYPPDHPDHNKTILLLQKQNVI